MAETSQVNPLVRQASADETPRSETSTLMPMKKAYMSPHVMEYGSVLKLTQTGSGTGADGGADPTMTMVCL